MLRVIDIFRYPLLNGTFIPFKTYIRSFITVRSNAHVEFSGRLTIGNPDPKAARVSVAPVNIYFGYCSKVNLGKSISIGPGVNIIVKDGAQLTVGDRSYFTSDMHLEAVKNITIGSDCAISWGVTIIDSNHHKVLPEIPYKDEGKVTIGNHVWIGCNVTILQGAEIGDHCIVAAGSVVRGKFPNNVMLAGNPAKIVKSSVSWE